MILNRDIFGNINQYYGIPLNDGPVKGGKRVIIKPNLGGKNE